MGRAHLAAAVLLAMLVAGCGTQQANSSSRTQPAKTATGTVRSRPRLGLVANARPRPGWRLYTGPVPIILYHELGTPPPSAPYPSLYVSDSDFAQEMAWLHDQGYEAVTLDEVMAAWHYGGRLPVKPIVISFDDGVVPQATFAPAVMTPYGWPGVLNEVVEGHLSNARLERLIKLGWEIDSHSLTHPDLRTLSPQQLAQEVGGSRRRLQRTLHIPVNSFCYPASKYDASVVAAVKAAGYTSAVTENSGFATPQTDPLLLPRFEIEGGVDVLRADLNQRP